MNQREQSLADTRSRIMQQAKRQIWVTFQKEGIHCYPAAASDPALATGDEYDVSFLASPHRHIFHFQVWIDVVHNDRDIEFIQFKRWLENLYRDRSVWIEVSEDGENGALVKYEITRPSLSIKI